MKFALFITSGIGNALYLVPLIKALKKQGSVTCIATSPFHSERVFDGFNDELFENTIVIRNTLSLIKLLPGMLSPFDAVYLDHFAATRKHLIMAHFIGKAVHTNHTPSALSSRFRKRLQLSIPKVGIHEGSQYLRYVAPDATDSDLNEERFALKPKPIRDMGSTNYITLQPGAGNSKTPWKTWPDRSWMEFIAMLSKAYPETQLIVLGDETEMHMNRVFEGVSPKVQALAGQTTLEELPGIIAGAQLHIGGDSAMLHVAGCVGTRTITICGGSDPEIFGWHKIDEAKHLLVKHTISCHPCYRWILPNRSRVDDASKCPDFKCIRSIEPAEVLAAVKKHMPNHAS